MKSKRGNVWLAAAGAVINSEGQWLVVKKAYGGLKGEWSLPAGFVEANETADEAAVREVREETGVETAVQGIIGIRSGVIQNSISDNMIVFHLTPAGNIQPAAKAGELLDACWLSPEELAKSPDTSVLVRHLVPLFRSASLTDRTFPDPGARFGYTDYKVFL